MLVRELMTADVETVQESEDVSTVLQKLAERHFTGFPVVDDDGRLVGVVTQRDMVELFQPEHRTVWIPIGLPPFLESLEYGFELSWDDLEASLDLASSAGKPVKRIMTEDVLTVEPDDSVDDILEILAHDDRDVNRVPVVEDGDLVGIVTRQDVLRALHAERSGE
ncbi:CBS domain-containing protein [Halobacterium jilantaiense]|uniref:CBS domain-containing protein n=1 Tax=Halobacterium jilantaiense TaxID=355548 RepID=A0A1I0QK94_9EURY|nr:CBS domain-containing protein [Halobacterium jilantaiense]SEW27645.1 CBS domain-containing protein [Halobacterium jilantaiense]